MGYVLKITANHWYDAMSIYDYITKHNGTWIEQWYCLPGAKSEPSLKMAVAHEDNKIIKGDEGARIENAQYMKMVDGSMTTNEMNMEAIETEW